MRGFLIIVVIANLLSGCASTRLGSTFYEAPQPKENKSLIYIYRPYSQPTLREPTISIDGSSLISMPNKSYVWVHVVAGERIIKSEWTWDTGVPKTERIFHFEPGKVYYIRVGSRMYNKSEGTYTRILFLSVPNQDLEFSASITNPEPYLALDEMSALRELLIDNHQVQPK